MIGYITKIINYIKALMASEMILLFDIQLMRHRILSNWYIMLICLALFLKIIDSFIIFIIAVI